MRARALGFILVRIVLASLGVVTVVFLALRLAGDPVAISMPPGTPLDVQEMYRKAWGLDGTLWQQYLRFTGKLLHGDLGHSVAFDRPAAEVILSHLSATLRLMLGASLVAAVYAYLSTGFFWMAAEKRRFLRATELLGSVNAVIFALSDFVMAILAIIIFGLYFGVSFSPETGRWNLFIGSFCVGLPFAAYFALASRRLAESHLKHPQVQFFTDATSTTWRNYHSLFLPVLLRQLTSLLLLRFVWLTAGTFVVESVLGIRGIGYLTIRSVQQRDLNITQGVVLMVALLSVMANVISDASQSRTRSGPA
jgi:peptide/nickel transport system permease protein